MLISLNSFTRRSVSLFLLLAFALGGPAVFAAPTVAEQRADILKMRDAVLDELYALHPSAKTEIKKAVGYAVFSNVGINLVFASFAGGKGVVVKKGVFSDSEIYMKMGSAGIGLGLGVKDFRGVFVFSDAAALDSFVEKGWDFSGQADAAAKSDEKGAAASGSATVISGVRIYQMTKNGLALQATLQGTKYWKNRDLN